MGHFTTVYEYGKRTHDFFCFFLFFLKFSLLYFRVVFNKTVIPLALVGYEIIIGNSALCASLAGYLQSHIQGALVE